MQWGGRRLLVSKFGWKGFFLIFWFLQQSCWEDLTSCCKPSSLLFSQPSYSTPAARFMPPVFLFLPLLAALPINTRLDDWGSVFFFFSFGEFLEDAAPLVFPPLPLCCFCFWSIGIYSPSPAPTLTLSHMLIWHFLLKGHGWIMFCRRGGGCYMKTDVAGVFCGRNHEAPNFTGNFFLDSNYFILLSKVKNVVFLH